MSRHCPKCEGPLTDTVPGWGRCLHCKGLFRLPQRQDVPRPVDALLSLYRDPGTLTIAEEPLRGERVAGTILLGLSALGVFLAIPIIIQGVNVFADRNPAGGIILNLLGFFLLLTCLRIFCFAWRHLFGITTYLFDAGCVTIYRDAFLFRPKEIVIDRSLLEHPFPLQHVKYLMLPLSPEGKPFSGAPHEGNRATGSGTYEDSFGNGTADYPGVFHGVGISYGKNVLRIRTGGAAERRWLTAALNDFFDQIPYEEQLYRRQLDRMDEAGRKGGNFRKSGSDHDPGRPASSRRYRLMRGAGGAVDRTERLDRVPRADDSGGSHDAGLHAEFPENTAFDSGAAVLELHCPKCHRTVPGDSFELAEETVQCFWCRNAFAWREAAEAAEREAGRLNRPRGSRFELSFPEGNFGKTLHLVLPPRRWFGRAPLNSLVTVFYILLVFLWYIVAISTGLGFLIGALSEQGLNLQDHYNDRLIELVVEQYGKYGLGILGALAAWFAVGAVVFTVLRSLRRLLAEQEELTLTPLTLKLVKATPHLSTQGRLFPRERFLYLTTDARTVPGSVYRFGSGSLPLYLVTESGTVEIACRNEAERRWIRTAIRSYAGESLEV